MNTKTAIMLLQEYTQKRQIKKPEYEYMGFFSDTFRFRVLVGGVHGTGEGKSKMQARQKAAEEALTKLDISLTEIDNVGQSENFIGSLQVYCMQIMGGALPEYHLIGDWGMPHCKTFEYECVFNGIRKSAKASTKKAAKNLAASYVMKEISQTKVERLDINHNVNNVMEEETLTLKALDKFKNVSANGQKKYIPEPLSIDRYPFSLVDNLSAEKCKNICQFIKNNNFPSHAEKLMRVLEIANLTCNWTSIPSKRGDKFMCVRVDKLSPPVCLIGNGSDVTAAKEKAAERALDYFYNLSEMINY